ncbi:MAG: hypothetical protein K2H53_03475 [Clostridia bacterium]|nr:hypothetical protein [Clostridia bacterium]
MDFCLYGGDIIKTVVENNKDIYRKQGDSSVEKVHPFTPVPKKSCFYDFGAPSPVEYAGFVKDGDSPFIDEVGDLFRKE